RQYACSCFENYAVGCALGRRRIALRVSHSDCLQCVAESSGSHPHHSSSCARHGAVCMVLSHRSVGATVSEDTIMAGSCWHCPNTCFRRRERLCGSATRRVWIRFTKLCESLAATRTVDRHSQVKRRAVCSGPKALQCHGIG